MELHWSAATRFHDWFDADLTFPNWVVKKLEESNLIGEVDWVEYGFEDKKLDVAGSGNHLQEYLKQKKSKKQFLQFTAGGSVNGKWKISIGLSKFNEQIQQVLGYNIINFWFSLENGYHADDSKQIIEIFKMLHSDKNTEFAFMHPWERVHELTDFAKSGPYTDPITISPMFSGVYWVNFLGAKHLEFFELKELKRIDSPYFEWIGEDSLLIILTSDYRDSLNPDVEKEMFSLTQKFKECLI